MANEEEAPKGDTFMRVNVGHELLVTVRGFRNRALRNIVDDALELCGRDWQTGRTVVVGESQIDESKSPQMLGLADNELIVLDHPEAERRRSEPPFGGTGELLGTGGAD